MIVGGVAVVAVGAFFAQAAGGDIQQARIWGILWEGPSLGELYMWQAGGVAAILLGLVIGAFGIKKLL